MKVRRTTFALVLASVVSMAAHNLSLAQTASVKPETPMAATAPTAVPALVPYSGTAIGSGGKALAGEHAATFLIFKDEQGGEPLFSETQTVTVDDAGHYKVQLGAANLNGLPSDLFSTGEARWLEIQIAGEPAQPRVLLASVPYALKAADAATLGGLPASAFALATAKNPVGAAAASSAVTPDTLTNVTTPGGVSGYLSAFSGASTIVNSPVFVNGANVGVGTITPKATLDVAGSVRDEGALTVDGASTLNGYLLLSPTGTASATKLYPSQYLKLVTSAYNSATQSIVEPRFQLQAEAQLNNTPSPTGTLNLLASTPTTVPVETGFYFNLNGTIHFAPGQTFPGTGTGNGTITGVTAGTGLIGGGTSGTVTLNVDATKVPLLGVGNTFVGNQTVSGTLNASSGSGDTIHGTDTGNSGSGVVGNATSLTGYTNGVYGATASSNGVGVSGVNTSSTGGVGVTGIATSTSGNTTGVGGTSNSSSGCGVCGNATSKTGYTNGVYGSVSSPNGTGVSGNALSTSGGNGVNGTAAGTTGVGVSATNIATSGGTAITGSALATSGYSNGIWGIVSSPNGTGVSGNATNSGGGIGTSGTSNSPQGVGVQGVNTSTTGGTGVSGISLGTSGYTVGVYASAVSPIGAGVRGDNLATTGSGPGVYGYTTSSSGIGVAGRANNDTGPTIGVQGVSQSASDGAVGVSGVANGNSGSTTGVQGLSLSSAGAGVVGTNASGGGGNGVMGIAITTGALSFGVQGIAGPGGVGVQGSSPDVGISGWNNTCDPNCVLKPGIAGQFATATGGLLLQGIVGNDASSATEKFHVDASGNGYFAGNLNVTGSVSKGGGSFKIDDPLDPANKYLSHSFVESPDMMDVYNGNIITDKAGRATVELPEYFESLNRDFRYQLTVVGKFAQATVATEIGHNHFVIRTSKPSVKVSWQVTGIRKDAYANANRIPVEEEKPADERGYYLHPELFNQPGSKSIVAAHHTGVQPQIRLQQEVAQAPTK